MCIGDFTDDNHAELFVNMDSIEYKKAMDFKCEINIITCEGLNKLVLIRNNNLNMTATCTDVNFASDS